MVEEVEEGIVDGGNGEWQEMGGRWWVAGGGQKG